MMFWCESLTNYQACDFKALIVTLYVWQLPIGVDRALGLPHILLTVM